MAANYDLPENGVVKRVRFFDGQLLIDQDFIDDQRYHVDRQRRTNRMLRVSGICEGLTLEVNNSKVTVKPGTALDSLGRLIVLHEPRPVVENLSSQTGDLDIYISYQEVESDVTQASSETPSAATGQPANDSEKPLTGAKGATRWWENPKVEFVRQGGGPTGERPLFLGRVTASTGALSLSDRQYSGIYLPSSVDLPNAPTLRSGGTTNPTLAILTGDLRVTGTSTLNGNVSMGGTLAVTGNSILDGTLTVKQDLFLGNISGGSKKLFLTNSAITHYIQANSWWTEFVSHSNEGWKFISTNDGVTRNERMRVTGSGNVGIGTDNPGEKLEVNGNFKVTGNSTLTGNVSMGGTLAVTGTRQIIFSDAGTDNNLKLQLWAGYGLGINGGTLFYAANGRHSWRDNNGTNERMALTTGADGSLTVTGSGTSSFAGSLSVGSSLTVTGTSTLNGILTVNNTVALKGSSTATGLSVNASGDVSIGSTLAIGTNTNAAFRLTPSDTSPNAGYIRFGDQTGWKLHFARSKEIGGSAFNTGTTGTLMTIQDNGNVGIGTLAPDSKLHIDKGRVDITASDATGGGQNRFNGLRSPTEEAYKRSQLVLSSGYSDLVIASSSSNGLHGSTLTFATYNPDNATQYRKWVINQGNWGDRKQFLEFGYSDANGRANPHDSINATDTVLTLDGINKRVGIGTRTPGEKLEVNGNLKVTGTSTLTGNVSMDGNLSFGSTVRQMINLWDTKYGIGVQDGTQYFRTDGYFAWYKGGSHTNGALEAGLNGAVQMVIKDGNVGIGTTNPQGFHVNLPEANRAATVPGISIAGGSSGNASIELRNNGTGTPFIDFSQSATADYDARIRLIDSDTLVIEGANLGIGTTTLSENAKLHVEGAIYCKGIWVDGPLNYKWMGGWKNIQNRGGDMAGSYSTAAPSDLRFKTDLRPISNAMEKVTQLCGTVYRWGEIGLEYLTRNIETTVLAGPNATEEENRKHQQVERQKAYEALSGEKIGLIAQNVESVVPEVVHEDEAGYKYIDYQHLVALLVEAIKEQNGLIQHLDARIAALEYLR